MMSPTRQYLGLPLIAALLSCAGTAETNRFGHDARPISRDSAGIAKDAAPSDSAKLSPDLATGFDLHKPASDGPVSDSAARDSALPVEAAVPDAATPPADGSAATDGTAPLPCSAKAAALLPPLNNIAFCRSNATVSVTQCDAEALCNVAGGWRLCTASEYRAAYTQQPPPSLSYGAWIAGCVRSSGVVSAPVDAICNCAATAGANVSYGWSCDNLDVVGSIFLEVGLYSHQRCYRAGQSTDTGAYWKPIIAAASLLEAVCCRTP
ncbi:MAG: hypothetical protein H6707_14830 [Deltaproteobacteria bacterium]|nr:hypothetical protein [Deltaproteobacteria bacterium]